MSDPITHAIILCHPREDSFAASVASRYAETVRKHRHEVVIRDLYRLGFDPVLRETELLGSAAPDVEAELDLLSRCDVFVLVHPIWFGTPPAMLKGYVDRVFGAGRLPDTPASASSSILSGKHLVTFTSSGMMRTWLEEKGVLGSLRNLFDRYLTEVFGLAGSDRFHFDGVSEDVPGHDIRLHLAEVEDAARQVMSRFVNRPPADLPGSGAGRTDARPHAGAMLPDPTLAEQPELALTTRTGTMLRLRPASEADVRQLEDLFKRLSPEDLRFRFLDTRRHVGPDEVAALLAVDHRHGEHVLAFDARNGRLAASLMIAADDRMETAEVAIAVAAEYKGRGIGWTLLRHAADLARERGVKRLQAIESRSNHDALEVERALGFRAREVEGDPSLVLVEADLG